MFYYVNRVLDRLWIGAARDQDGTTPLVALGFVAVVDLREPMEAPSASDQAAGNDSLACLELKNRDGEPWPATDVDRAMGFIHDQIRRGRVLVACNAGMSRSASVVIGYLVRCGWSEPEAHEAVKRARPEIAPKPAMIRAALQGVAIEEHAKPPLRVA